MSVEAVLAALPATGSVEVRGDGDLARQVTAAVQDRAAGEERPAVVVETSGGADAVAAALARVADDGTVVLAGPLLDEVAAVNLYADLHARCITLVGVEPGS